MLYDSRVTELTQEEYLVLILIGNGLTSSQISELMYISVEIVEAHREHLLTRFSSKNTAELMRKASKVLTLQ